MNPAFLLPVLSALDPERVCWMTAQEMLILGVRATST
jgi:hypothetical protein